MKTALIIAASPEQEINYIKDTYDAIAPDLVICADGGILKANLLGIKCDILMGDMDSGGRDFSGETIIFPAVKNFTDLHSAIDKAIDCGCETLVITGASGGRLDHLLCNIHLIEAAEMRGVRARLVDSMNIVTIFECGKFFVPDGFKYFSIIPLDCKLTGVSISNCKYPLDGAELLRYDSLAVSNEPKTGEVSAFIQSGRALLIFSK